MILDSRRAGKASVEARGRDALTGSRAWAAVETSALTLVPVDLETASATSSASRVDSKYLFPIDLLPEILNAVRPVYRILEISGRRLSRYRTTYYDTRGLTFYHNHRTDRLPRRKVRRRDYLETRTAFLEVKETNSQSRTVKARVPVPAESIDEGDGLADIRSLALPYSVPPESLGLSIAVDYTRITLVGSTPLERVTFDLGLRATRGVAVAHYPDAVIAEVKQLRVARSSFVRELRSRNIREVNLSKYCVCLAALEPGLQRNRFSEDLRKLQPYQATSP